MTADSECPAAVRLLSDSSTVIDLFAEKIEKCCDSYVIHINFLTLHDISQH
jgi:hypothetical protein